MVPFVQTDMISFSARSRSKSLMSDFILLVSVLLFSDGRVLPGEEEAWLCGLPVTVERLVGGRFAVDFVVPLRL